MSKYRERSNNPAERQRWNDSGLVQAQSLHVGDVFECVDGNYWQVHSRNSSGTIHVVPWGHETEPTDFIRTAGVRPVMRKQYMTPTEFPGRP